MLLPQHAEPAGLAVAEELTLALVLTKTYRRMNAGAIIGCTHHTSHCI